MVPAVSQIDSNGRKPGVLLRLKEGSCLLYGACRVFPRLENTVPMVLRNTGVIIPAIRDYTGHNLARTEYFPTILWDSDPITIKLGTLKAGLLNEPTGEMQPLPKPR